MGGPVAIAGFNFQTAQAVVRAIDILDDTQLGALRVEGGTDLVDVEIFNRSGKLVEAIQYKQRRSPYTWSRGELVDLLNRWAAAQEQDAHFSFVTDGDLGPSGLGVQTALLEAELGNTLAIEQILDREVAKDDPITRASIRVENASVEALLELAMRRIELALAPSVDAQQLARSRVESLFARLFLISGDQDLARRYVRRDEVAGILGLPADIAPEQRWSSELRRAYTKGLSTRDSATGSYIDLKLKSVGVSGDGSELSSNRLLRGTCSILMGPTGSGKSTIVDRLAHTSGATQSVIVAAADTYIPGRLDNLAAVALGTICGRSLPPSTGAAVLADASNVLVIDGASEIPREDRDALRTDLKALAASSSPASVVLTGRDLSSLKALFPRSSEPNQFEVLPMTVDQQFELVEAKLASRVGKIGSNLSPSQIQHAASELLTGAAGNPLLFELAVEAIADGIVVQDRATLYKLAIERLHGRGSIEDVDVACVRRLELRSLAYLTWVAVTLTLLNGSGSSQMRKKY